MSDGKQWITAKVELPQPLLDAHSEGRVVFFVGAGASKAAPASLPLFEELATTLGAEAGVPYTKPKDGAAEPLDRFLGRLTHLTPPYAVHQRAHEVLTRLISAPNDWHDAIVRLAAAYGNPRIVTTNFDDHLHAAATAAGLTFSDKWVGPALPLGHSVAGLVHLHGSVTRGHNELVLTDKDLGQAYLSEAWATRFLLKLFEENVVVFVGYGLTDPTMRYLTLGLPSGASLYALTRTSESSDPDWVRLGVTTIPFGEEFEDVPRALNAWDTRARMGQLDHGARVETLVLAGTTLSPVDRDYLTARVGTLEGARDFVQAVEKLTDESAKVAWLHWAESHPTFLELFSPPEISEAAGVLGNWFVRSFVQSPDLHGAAFHTIMRLGQRMAAPLFQSACAATWELEKAAPVPAERWRAFLSTSVFGQTAPLNSELFLPYLPEVRARSTTLLRSVLRPYLKLRRRWFDDEASSLTSLPNAEVEWAATDYALTHHLLLSVQQAPAGDRTLGGVLEEALVSAYDLLSSFHGERGWDALSHGRSAIEQHEQDHIREPLDAIVDALREYGLKARDERRDLIARWWDLGHPLFQRLALHLLTTDPSITADDKLEWLLARTGLFPDHLKHELFHLLAASLPAASDDLRNRVLAATLEGPDIRDDVEDREGHSDYAKFNLLVWLTASAPDWTEATEAMSKIQQENPTFGPREHPDFDMWMSGGVWGGKLPLSPEEFIELLSENSATALEILLARDYSERHFEEPNWDDALRLVRQVAGTRADMGIALWVEVDCRGELDGKSDDLRRATAAGWGEADLGEHGEIAVGHVASLVADPESAHAIGRFLLEQIQRQVESDETPMLAAMRALAQNLWDSQSAQFTHGYEDPISAAPLFLNAWPGFLAQYWPQEIDRRWRHNREQWTGLNEEEREAMIALLSGPRAALDATQPAIARVLQFLFAADSDFATEHVLTLFRDVDSAALAWHSYLFSPRWDDKILAAGLLESMNEQWDRLDQMGDRGHRQQFFGLVTAVLSWAGIDEDSRHALLTRSVIGADGKHAADFAATVARFLTEESVDGNQIWARWLRGHVTERLNGVPRIAASEELIGWADAVPYLGEAIPEAVTLLSGRGIGFEDGWFSRDIPEATLQAHGIALASHFAERLHNTTSTSIMLGYRVRELVKLFREALGEDAAQPLLDAARGRGFIDGVPD